MSEKVSVIIPTYNRVHKLPRAIDSVLKQTYQNWELLIVDDGSTDNTKQSIHLKYGNNSKIQFIERTSSREKGANACRNIGIEEATGEFVALLDSDDEWKPKHIECCQQIVLNTEDFQGCYSGYILERDGYEFKRDSRKKYLHESHFDFLLNARAPTPSYFLSGKCALDIKFDENLQRHQDWDFFIRFGQKYDWEFNNNLNVVVHWSIEKNLKKPEIISCIEFYQKYGHKLNNRQSKERYLYSMYKSALIQEHTEAVSFYKKELKIIDCNRVALSYPIIYRYFELLKRKLHVKRFKKTIKFYLNQAKNAGNT